MEAYLESLYRYFPSELFQTYILYKVELFAEEYEQLFKKFPNCVIVKEMDFHTDFLNILSRIDTKYVLFGVDDVVFFNSVDFNVIDQTFIRNTKDIFGFSLRFGQEIVENSRDIVNKTLAGGQTVFYLDWTKGQTPNTRYPFELCATVYQADLVKKVLNNVINKNPIFRKIFVPNSFLIKAIGRIISTRSTLKSFGYFFNPNTMESWNCRWCRNNSDKLPDYLYFQKLCASAIQVNIVNTSTNSETIYSHEHTVEAINEKYKNGYRLDIDFVSQDKPTATHCGRGYFKLIKSQ